MLKGLVSLIKIGIFISFTLLLLIASGCENEPPKTDSMMYRDAVINAAQAPIVKAELLLTDTVKHNPMNHLDSLIIVKNAMIESMNIYRKGKIGSYKDSKIENLNHYFDTLNPLLYDHAKTLLIELVDKTTQLRDQIEEAKNQPFSARGNDTAPMVSFLADQYNKNIKTCCLNKLSQIDQLLQTKPRQYRELLILIRSINAELGKVIQQRNYAAKLKHRINTL
jgi:hypothetical protein